MSPQSKEHNVDLVGGNNTVPSCFLHACTVGVNERQENPYSVVELAKGMGSHVEVISTTRWRFLKLL